MSLYRPRRSSLQRVIIAYMSKKEFSAITSLSVGWETFLKRPSFLMAVTAAVGIIMLLLRLIAHGSPVLVFIFGVIGIFVGMGLVHFALKAQKDVRDVHFADLWYPKPFWAYLAAAILVGLIVVVGFILIIIPGLFALSLFAFTKYIVIDKNMGPIEAMKESIRITKGHRLEVLLLIALAIVINIIGMLPLMLGLLVTIPVTIFSFAGAYRTLEGARKDHKAEASA